MGTWGTSIFADDIAADVRDDYRDLIAGGIPDAAASAQIQKTFLEHEPGMREAIEPLFWLALARAQWDIGRLDEATKAKALEVIESGQEIQRWRNLDASEADLTKRASVLAALRDVLQSPQNPRKKLRPRKQQTSPYQVGDVVSFKLSTGRCVLFRVTSLCRDRSGEFPVAEPLDWIGTTPPPISELAALPCRKRIAGTGSINYPRILLGETVRSGFDHSRLSVIARGLPMPKMICEGFSAGPMTGLEEALAVEFGLK